MHHHFHWELAGSIIILIGIILIAVLLRRRGFLTPDHGSLFSGLILKVTLPALIFKSLFGASVDLRLVYLVGIMLGAQFLVLAISYSVGRWMRLSQPKLGTLILTSAFGSSGLLGYALVSQAFPGNAEAMTEAAMISEMAVAPFVFTAGVLVAMYFGSGEKRAGESLKSVLHFFYSPVFIALIAGLICSAMNLPKPAGPFKLFFNGLGVIASSNTFLAAMTVGVSLRLKDVRACLGVVAAACFLKLLLEPGLVWASMEMTSVSDLHQQILVIEAAMPAMILSVPFAKKYGCDAECASIVLLATNSLSIFTMMFVLSILVG